MPGQSPESTISDGGTEEEGDACEEQQSVQPSVSGRVELRDAVYSALSGEGLPEELRRVLGRLLTAMSRGATAGLTLKGGLHLSSALIYVFGQIRRGAAIHKASRRGGRGGSFLGAGTGMPEGTQRSISLAIAVKDTLVYTVFLASLGGTYVAVDEGLAAALGKERTSSWRALVAGLVAAQTLRMTGRKQRHYSLATYVLLRGLTLLVRCGNKPTGNPLLRKWLAPTRWVHGDAVLMCIASSQILYSFIMMPSTLPAQYVRFINKQGAKELYVWRAIQEQALRNSSGLSPGPLQSLMHTSLEHLNMPPDCHATVPCSFFHPGQTCGGHALGLIPQAYTRALSVYMPVYVLPALLVHRTRLLRQPFLLLPKLALGIGRSAAFLAFFIATAFGGACVGFNMFGISTGPGIAASVWAGGLAVLLEKKSRRIELALYCLSRAMEAWGRCVLEWGWISPDILPARLDVILFALGCGAISHCYSDAHGLHRDVFRSKYLNVLDLVFGNSGVADGRIHHVPTNGQLFRSMSRTMISSLSRTKLHELDAAYTALPPGMQPSPAVAAAVAALAAAELQKTGSYNRYVSGLSTIQQHQWRVQQAQLQLQQTQALHQAQGQASALTPAVFGTGIASNGTSSSSIPHQHSSQHVQLHSHSGTGGGFATSPRSPSAASLTSQHQPFQPFRGSSSNGGALQMYPAFSPSSSPRWRTTTSDYGGTGGGSSSSPPHHQQQQQQQQHFRQYGAAPNSSSRAYQEPFLSHGMGKIPETSADSDPSLQQQQQPKRLLPHAMRVSSAAALGPPPPTMLPASVGNLHALSMSNGVSGNSSVHNSAGSTHGGGGGGYASNKSAAGAQLHPPFSTTAHGNSHHPSLPGSWGSSAAPLRPPAFSSSTSSLTSSLLTQAAAHQQQLDRSQGMHVSRRGAGGGLTGSTPSSMARSLGSSGTGAGGGLKQQLLLHQQQQQLQLQAAANGLLAQRRRQNSSGKDYAGRVHGLGGDASYPLGLRHGSIDEDAAEGSSGTGAAGVNRGSGPSAGGGTVSVAPQPSGSSRSHTSQPPASSSDSTNHGLGSQLTAGSDSIVSVGSNVAAGSGSFNGTASASGGGANVYQSVAYNRFGSNNGSQPQRISFDEGCADQISEASFSFCGPEASAGTVEAFGAHHSSAAAQRASQRAAGAASAWLQAGASRSSSVASQEEERSKEGSVDLEGSAELSLTDEEGVGSSHKSGGDEGDRSNSGSVRDDHIGAAGVSSRGVMEKRIDGSSGLQDGGSAPRGLAAELKASSFADVEAAAAAATAALAAAATSGSSRQRRDKHQRAAPKAHYAPSVGAAVRSPDGIGEIDSVSAVSCVGVSESTSDGYTAGRLAGSSSAGLPASRAIQTPSSSEGQQRVSAVAQTINFPASSSVGARPKAYWPVHGSSRGMAATLLSRAAGADSDGSSSSYRYGSSLATSNLEDRVRGVSSYQDLVSLPGTSLQ